jgi:hypothetical protein
MSIPFGPPLSVLPLPLPEFWMRLSRMRRFVSTAAKREVHLSTQSDSHPKPFRLSSSGARSNQSCSGVHMRDTKRLSNDWSDPLFFRKALKCLLEEFGDLMDWIARSSSMSGLARVIRRCAVKFR